MKEETPGKKTKRDTGVQFLKMREESLRRMERSVVANSAGKPNKITIRESLVVAKRRVIAG